MFAAVLALLVLGFVRPEHASGVGVLVLALLAGWLVATKEELQTFLNAFFTAAAAYLAMVFSLGAGVIMAFAVAVAAYFGYEIIASIHQRRRARHEPDLNNEGEPA